jgi:rhodanese-related sulfurtransferase
MHMNATQMSPPPLAPNLPKTGDPILPDRINPTRLAALLNEGGKALLLDVRSPVEYDAQHVPGSVLQPLDTLKPEEWASKTTGGPLYVFCQSGGRASRAAALLAKQGVACCVVEGGLEAWTAAGLPVEKAVSNVLPLMRQVQLVIGLVSGTGAALAIWRHPLFALIPLFTSAGLVFAGATGYCGLALLMARMPWNQRRAAGSGARAATGAAASCCATPGDAQ